jgi:hypothetical protein
MSAGLIADARLEEADNFVALARALIVERDGPRNTHHEYGRLLPDNVVWKNTWIQRVQLFLIQYGITRTLLFSNEPPKPCPRGHKGPRGPLWSLAQVLRERFILCLEDWILVVETWRREVCLDVPAGYAVACELLFADKSSRLSRLTLEIRARISRMVWDDCTFLEVGHARLSGRSIPLRLATGKRRL